MKFADAIVALAKRTGRFKDWTGAERATRHAEVVSFDGDIPGGAGVEHNQRRLVLVEPAVDRSTDRVAALRGRRFAGSNAVAGLA